MDDNTFAIQRLGEGTLADVKQTPLLIRFMESARKLDEYYFFNDNDRKIKISAIMMFYVEIMSKFEELAEQYRAPIRDKIQKMKEEWAKKLREDQEPRRQRHADQPGVRVLFLQRPRAHFRHPEQH